MADPSDLDDRLIRLADLLEQALELVSDAHAPMHLAEIARLCREAAALAQG